MIPYTAKSGKEFVVVIDIGPKMRGEYKGPNVMNGYRGGDYYATVTAYAPESMQQYFDKYLERVIYTNVENSDPRVGYGSHVPSRAFESLFSEDSIADLERKGKREARRNQGKKHKGKRSFSMADVVEETPNLVAVHNVTEDKLRGAL